MMGAPELTLDHCSTIFFHGEENPLNADIIAKDVGIISETVKVIAARLNVSAAR